MERRLLYLPMLLPLPTHSPTQLTHTLTPTHAQSHCREGFQFIIFSFTHLCPLPQPPQFWSKRSRSSCFHAAAFYCASCASSCCRWVYFVKLRVVLVVIDYYSKLFSLLLVADVYFVIWGCFDCNWQRRWVRQGLGYASRREVFFWKVNFM